MKLVFTSTTVELGSRYECVPGGTGHPIHHVDSPTVQRAPSR